MSHPVQRCELVLQPPASLTRRIRAWGGREKDAPAFAQYDRFFRVGRALSEGVQAKAQAAAVAATVRLLSCTQAAEVDCGQALERALRVSCDRLGASDTASASLAAPTSAGVLDPHARWQIGHHLFFVLVQALVITHDQIVAARSMAGVKAELIHAATLFEGARSAIHLTAHMTPAEYDAVRSTMSPPNLSQGFSGQDSPDHAALISIARLAGQRVSELRMQPSLRATVEDYRVALDRLYTAHAKICERCVPDGPSLLGAHVSSGKRESRQVLEGLRDRFHRYTGTSPASRPSAISMGATMQRIPEPELMDQPVQAAAYAAADFSEPDTRFVKAFVGHFGEDFNGRIADLGCGPGNIALRLTQALPLCEVVGIDGAASMLEQARSRARRFGAAGSRVRWVQAVLPSNDLPAGAFEAVVSNSLLHHLHDPTLLWRTILRIAAPGAVVLVGDLRRPRTENEAHELVQTHAADESPMLREDFFASLCASFEPDEVRAALREAGLSLAVDEIGDRHLLVWGRIGDSTHTS